MEDLEGHMAIMAWDWDTNDIDVDKDDGRLWVPVTPQTMTMADTPRPGQVGPSIVPTMLPRQMTVYALQLSQDGPAEQVSMPTVIPVHTPQCQGDVIIKENLDRGSK